MRDSELGDSALQLIEDFAEVVGARFASEPLGGANGTQGEAAAAAGIVAKLEGVVVADRGDDVLAVGVSYAVGSDGDFNARANRLDDFLERDGGAGGGVELGGVVGLVDGEA
jgi:hypothetical protein